MTQKSFLYVENIARRFAAARGGEALTVFENVSFGIDKGEFVCIIGHSGCGKSTILNILAGLDEPSEGYVFMSGREISGPALDRGDAEGTLAPDRLRQALFVFHGMSNGGLFWSRHARSER